MNPLDGMLVHCRLLPFPPLPYYFNSLPSLTVFPFLSWVGRGIVRGNCFAQMQTSQPGVQSANKRPTASLKQQKNNNNNKDFIGLLIGS